jgi:tape measure domain-containing protein
MANQKILTLGFKINIDEAGKAKLDNIATGLNRSLDATAAKTLKVAELEAKKLALQDQQKTLADAVAKYIDKQNAGLDKQNAALAKNANYQNLIDANLSRAEQKYTKINESLYRQLNQLKEISTYIDKAPAVQATASTGWDSVANQAKVKASNDARKKELEDRETFFVSIETRLADKLKDITKFRVDANTDWERKQAKVVVDEKVAMYTALFDTIDARTARSNAFTSKMASGTAGSSMIGGMTTAAKNSISPTTSVVNSAPIVTNTDALNKNKVAADAATKTHTNLFLRVGEAIGAYRIWNTVLTSVQSALLSIPQAGIQQQQALSSIYAIFGTEEGNKNLKFLQQLSSSAGQYIGDLQEAYRKFAPSAMLAGAKQEEVNQIFEDFTKVSTVLHFSTDQVKSLYLALEQMYAKTTVQSEEIKKQLGNVLPGAVEIGAKAWASYTKSADKSVAAFMEAMKKNLVVTKEFAPAFAKEYEAIFGGKDDSIFLDASTKLLSNINRVRTASYNIATDLFDITATTMNGVVKLAATSLDSIQANLQGVVQGVEATAIVVGTSLTIAFTKLALSARGLAVLAAVFNPIVLGTAAAGAAITVLATKTTGMEVKYGRFTAASKEQIAELMKTYAAQGEGAKQAGEELERLTEKSNSFSLLYQGMQIEFQSLGSSILSSLSNAVSIWWNTTFNFLKKGFDGLVILFQETFGTKVTNIIVYTVSKVKDVLSAIGLTRIGEDFQVGVTTALKNIADDAKKTQEDVNKAKQAAKPTVFTAVDPTGNNNPLGSNKGKAAAASKALKDAYKDIARETKLAVAETATLLDELASKYASNLISIKDYYAKRVALQLALVETEKNIQGKMIARASAAGDTANVEKARDQIELLNEKAKQFQPIADKERTNELRTYNNTLANTTASYLELTNATVAATKARLELQNAPLKQQLQTQIGDATSTAPEKDKAKIALGQVTASEEISKINAAAEAAKNYRDKINEISISYTEMGATSADVLNTTLGGFSPIFNMLNNFQTEQAKIQAKMSDLVAEGERLAAIKIEVVKAPDTEANRAALEQNAKDTEINAKQKDLLNKESTKSQLTNMTNIFAMGENLAAKGSKTQKAMHNAYMVMETVKMAIAIKSAVVWIAAEYTKMSVAAASTGVSMGEAAATLVAQSGWAGFAGIAALAAIVATYAASGGSSTPTVTNTSAPVSNAAGSVFGDPEAISTSLEDTLSLLADINYKSYRELIKVNANLINTSNSIAAFGKQATAGITLAPSTAQLGSNPSGAASMASTAFKAYTMATTVITAILTMTVPIVGLAVLALSQIPVIGKAIDAVINFFAEGLFGKVTIKSIDKGVMGLKTSAKNILTGADALIVQYETLEKTKESWFSKSSQIYDVFQAATKGTVDIFTNIYRGMANSIKTLASQISESALVNLYKYQFSGFKLSLLDTKDITKTVTGLMNKELDKMAMAVFGSMFKGLRDLKEGMFATVSRLFIQKEVVKGYFKDLGASFTVNSEQGILFADALVRVSSNAATGAERLKEFAKQQEDFFNSFATTIMKNNKTVANFAQGLSAVFNQGLSVDQITKTKALYDYNVANNLYTASLVKSIALKKAETAVENAKTPAQLKKAETKLATLEIPYEAVIAVAQDNLTKATTKYNLTLAESNTNVTGSVAAFNTLKGIFFDTVKTTGDFGAAVIAVRQNLDLSTASGMQASVMLTNLSDEFKKLFDAIIQPIKNQITSIADSIDATSKADLLAQLAASKDFESQKSISVKIQKLIVDKYNTEKTAITNIKNSFISLAATVKTLLGGDLSTKNPYEKLQLAQTEYTDLLAKSRSTDLTVASDAASKLGASAQAYLTQAKSYFGATAQYADIFNSVTTTLNDLSQTAESAADASTAQLEALGKAAIEELNNLATVTTTAIVDALAEGIKALEIADVTKIATDQLSLLASKADNLGISFDALIAKFNVDMGTPASKPDSGIQSLVDKLATARAAGDKIEMAKIDAQIKSYNKGFGKGGAELGTAYASNRLEYQNNLDTIARLNKDKASAVGKAAKDAIQVEITALQSKNKLLVGAFADGGRVTSGMSLVGERGPELIQLPMGTNVIKNSTTNRLLEDSNRETLNILTDMKKELIILNGRMGTIERKTRLTKSTLSMA